MKPLNIDPEAAEEVNAASRWYEEQRDGLGDKFFGAVLIELSAIQAMPKRFPLYSKREPVRYSALQHFPYVILFRELDEEIQILNCEHTHKRPRFWG